MIVLDTHIWVWWVHGDERLTRTQAEVIEANDTDVIGVSTFRAGRQRSLWNTDDLGCEAMCWEIVGGHSIFSQRGSYSTYGGKMGTHCKQQAVHGSVLLLQRHFPNNVILSDQRERRIPFLAGNSSSQNEILRRFAPQNDKVTL